MRARRFLRESALSVLALGGALCIAAFAAALFWDANLMMFKTGSMSPGIPAGSVALVHTVPAESVGIGDVVTVDRPGQLPITHRVVGTRSIVGGSTELRLKGDANSVEDPEPYRVTEVGLLVNSTAGMAPLMMAARTPTVMVLTTIGKEPGIGVSALLTLETVVVWVLPAPSMSVTFRSTSPTVFSSRAARNVSAL